MTVPEENRAKTRGTDDTVERPDTGTPGNTGDTGQREPRENRTMRQAIEDAGISPDDYPEDYEEGS